MRRGGSAYLLLNSVLSFPFSPSLASLSYFVVQEAYRNLHLAADRSYLWNILLDLQVELVLLVRQGHLPG